MPLFQSKNLVAFHNQRYSPHPSRFHSAISSLHGYANVASSSLRTWSSSLVSHLPDSIQSFISVVPPDSRSSSLDPFFSFLDNYSPATYTTLLATLLGLIYLVAKYLMSYRSSLDGGWGGRRSPYTSQIPRDFSGFVEYVTGSNEMLEDRPGYSTHSHHKPSVARPHTDHNLDPDDAPDVIQLKYKAEEFKLNFRPFAISDGLLLVGDLRKYAAEKLRTDPSRVRMIYKGKRLVKDKYSAKHYGLKQNSEVSLVITEATSSAIDSASGSDDNSSSYSGSNRRHRPRGQSNVRHRSQDKVPVQSDFLHPSNAGIPRPQQERQTRYDSLNVPSNNNQDRRSDHSHSRAPSPDPSSTTNSSNSSFSFTPLTFPPNIDPTSPLGKIQTLSSSFHNKWLPLCDKYIRSPPSEPKSRDMDCKRLTESILTQIIMKLDELDLQGDKDAKSIRKGLVNRANEVMRMCEETNWKVNPRKEG